jgi:hypothetical protein
MGGGSSAPAVVTMEMVEEVHIDWTAETAGAIGATHIDSVTGATHTKGAPASPGDMDAVIGVTGLVMGGTPAAGNQVLTLGVGVGAMIDGATAGAAYDPTTDLIEIVLVCPSITAGPNGAEVYLQLYSPAGYSWMLGHIVTAGPTQTRRTRMIDVVGDTGTATDTASTFSAATFSLRIAGPSARIRWASSVASTAWADLSASATREVWSMRAGPLIANLDEPTGQDWTLYLVVIGQTGAPTSITVSDTYIRRWRGVAS